MPSLIPLLLLATSQATTAPIEVPFHLGDDAIIVDARVNGRDVSLMFDTGFGGAVLLNNNIDVGKPTGSMTLRDFVGEIDVPTVKMKSISLGAMKIDPSDMVIVQRPPENYSFAYGTHCDGIMGFSVIKHAITEINFEKKKFIFYPASFDISKRTPDGKKTFLNRLLPIGINSLEMLATTPSGKSMTLALDTGNAFYATTHRDVLERVGLWDAGKQPKFTRLSGVASGAVDSWSIKVPEISIFGVPVKNSVWDIIDLPSSSAEGDGTVGFGFLKNFNVIVDFERRRVWLENWNQPIEGEVVGDVGISAAYSERQKRVLVMYVAPESPAAKAGIKEGDSILSIGASELGNTPPRKLRKMMLGAIGSKVQVAISRDGNLRRIELVREALVN